MNKAVAFIAPQALPALAPTVFGAGAVLGSQMALGAIAGSLAGFVATGSLKGALIGGITGGGVCGGGGSARDLAV